MARKTTKKGNNNSSRVLMVRRFSKERQIKQDTSWEGVVENEKEVANLIVIEVWQPHGK